MSNGGEITLYLYLVQDNIEACYPPAKTIPDGNRQLPVLYAIKRRPAGKLFGSEYGPDLYQVYPDGSYPIHRPDLPCEVLHRLPADAVRLPDDEIRAYWRAWREKRSNGNADCATNE
jgi:hypothetical protein